ncbi:uncharacterized protein LOC124653982 [Lolium rigidum]|uniref:uncharacterized protein LOC124653982 n=1 Tax=Lolium rigidum TaxID=89674 RepID=UPI001F5CB945|nr:uncharacterized protein LOC124653982 [Lolium rigidum]
MRGSEHTGPAGVEPLERGHATVAAGCGATPASHATGHSSRRSSGVAGSTDSTPHAPPRLSALRPPRRLRCRTGVSRQANVSVSVDRRRWWSQHLRFSGAGYRQQKFSDVSGVRLMGLADFSAASAQVRRQQQEKAAAASHHRERAPQEPAAVGSAAPGQLVNAEDWYALVTGETSRSSMLCLSRSSARLCCSLQVLHLANKGEQAGSQDGLQ